LSGPLVAVDTNIFITARNPREAGHAPCRRFLDRVDRGDVRAIVSTITIAELRAGMDAEEIAPVWSPMLAHFLTSPNWTVVAVDSDVADFAGEIRADLGLSLPDAIVISTGQSRGARFLVTQDTKLHRLQLPMTVIGPGKLPE